MCQCNLNNLLILLYMYMIQLQHLCMCNSILRHLLLSVNILYRTQMYAYNNINIYRYIQKGNSMTQPYKPPYLLTYIQYMLVELVNYRSIYYCNIMSTKQSCYMCLCRIMIRQHEYLMYMLYAYFIWCIFICYI